MHAWWEFHGGNFSTKVFNRFLWKSKSLELSTLKLYWEKAQHLTSALKSWSQRRNSKIMQKRTLELPCPCTPFYKLSSLFGCRMCMILDMWFVCMYLFVTRMSKWQNWSRINEIARGKFCPNFPIHITYVTKHPNASSVTLHYIP